MGFEQNGMVYINQTDITDQSFHWHSELELMLVLEGEIELKVGYELLQLRSGDIMLINSDEIHNIKRTSDEAKIIFVYMDCNVCYDLFPDIYEILAFWCYADAFEKLNANKDLIIKNVNALALAMNKSSSSEVISEHFQALIKSLIFCYRINHIDPTESGSSTSDGKVDVIYRTIKYMYSNYDHKVNLQDISEQEYMNLFHLSHSFKDITGYSFRDWLNFVRAEQAEKMLLQTSLPLSEIAYKCGFSDVRYLNKHFSKWYQISPNKYRNLFKPSYEMMDKIKEYQENTSLPDIIENLSTITPTMRTSDVSNEIIVLDPENAIRESTLSMGWRDGLTCNYSWFEDPMNKSRIADLKTHIGFSTVTLDELFNIGMHDAEDLTEMHETLSLLLDIFTKVNVIISFNETYRNDLETAEQFFDEFYSLYPGSKCRRIECRLVPSDNGNYEDSEWLSAFKDFLTSIGVGYCTEGDYHRHTPKENLSSIVNIMTDEFRAEWFFTNEGFRSNLYYFCEFFSELHNNVVEISNNYIVTNYGSDFKILMFSDETRNYAPSGTNYTISLKNVSKDYKLIHYTWSISENDVSSLIKDPEVIKHLSAQEHKALDMLSSPDATFDYIPSEKYCDTGYDISLSLSSSNMHMLEFTAI